jgi:hypothetical protein
VLGISPAELDGWSEIEISRMEMTIDAVANWEAKQIEVAQARAKAEAAEKRGRR